MEKKMMKQMMMALLLALYRRCSFRLTGQCEGLSIVERVTEWLCAFSYVSTAIIIYKP